MAQQRVPPWPFATEVLGGNGNGNGTTDALPASYHYYEALGRRRQRHIVAIPAKAVPDFLDTELSLGELGEMLGYLWLAGSKHPATQLHFQVAMGRKIAVADRMGLHLLWDHDGRIFLKPIPRFLLDPDFWRRNLRCSDDCTCKSGSTGGESLEDPGQAPAASASCRENPRRVALGFLYTYACLISSEIDFFVANEERLLPRKADDSTIEWAMWKELVRELLERHDPEKIHPRFLRAELRLSRINTISRLTRLQPFDPYLRGWRTYGSLFRDNLAWLATAAIFIALVLTAMQVGLATDRLQGNTNFQRAAYGFTVFAILGPVCTFGLVILGALFNLVRDLPWLLGDKAAQPHGSLLVQV
ncbi:hypothetical protein ACHAPT_010537 [Fusarium lateritium]